MVTPKARCYLALLATWMSPRLPCAVMAPSPSMMTPLPRHSISYLPPDFRLLESVYFFPYFCATRMPASSFLFGPKLPGGSWQKQRRGHLFTPKCLQALQLRVCLLCSHLYILPHWPFCSECLSSSSLPVTRPPSPGGDFLQPKRMSSLLPLPQVSSPRL